MRRRSGRRNTWDGLRGAVLVTALALTSPDALAQSFTAAKAAGSVQGTQAPILAATKRVKGFGVHVDDALTGPQREFTVERIKPSALELLGEFRGVKRGVGLDWGLADTGNVHFNLYSGKDGFAHGKRWSIEQDDDTFGPSADGIAHGGRFWSVGATLDVVRFRSIDAEPARESRIVVSPQLLIDVGALTGFCGQCEMLVQGTMWRGADRRAIDDERVVQVSMKWRF
ncbi:MAG TPA: hypothetical protein VJM11_15680 [Nevskiaceae bacterium]|nr:hypothetical protein [Nevskiaceae bacterium]